MGAGAFQNCSSLSEANLPKAQSIETYAFSGCYNLKKALFESVSNISQYAFFNCSSLNQTSFPLCESIGVSAFQRCISLPSIYLPKCNYIGSNAFYNNVILSQVYMLGSSVATLDNTNAFIYTPLYSSSYLGYFGSIYVKASLVNDYKAATNWSYYADRIVGLTDQEIEGLE